MSLYLEHVSQQFDQTLALNDINIEIKPSEFIAILGPSGCGKTTLLRSIAGFIEPTGGTIRLNNTIYSGQNRMVPTEDRDLGMVFQSFALWPHMTVLDHIAFPMKSKRQNKLSKAEKEEAVQKALTAMGLEDFAHRLPGELSGGQRQRVSLARAIVGKPSILLMDEPLSALDAELKLSMRKEIQDLHHHTGATIIYVTHDQSEALAMADRIIVMRNGTIEQIGTPQEIYTHPATKFVATFVSKCNLIPGYWQNGEFQILQALLSTSDAICWKDQEIGEAFKEAQLFPVRPEEFKITKEQAGIAATITNRQYNGREIQYTLANGKYTFTVLTKQTELYDIGEEVHLVLPQ